MSFNIIAESTGKLDYKKIHTEIYSKDLGFDFIPLPDLGRNGGDALGICVPSNNADEQTWKHLEPVLKKLKSKFHCDVYDLYGGQKLGLFNIGTFRNNFFLK